MWGRWKPGYVTFVFVCLTCIVLILSCRQHSNQSANLSGFEVRYGHPYYVEAQEAGQRPYFEGAISDLVKCLGEETGCCLESREAAAYLEYMLEWKGYEVNIVAGQGQDEIGILVYDELQDDWVQWEWGTKSLSDFGPETDGIDSWSDWKKSRKYEDIYQVEDSIEDFTWWNLPQADELDEFAQSLEYLPVPGFRISNVNARVDEDNWEVVEGESKATVQISYIMNRYGDYECEFEDPSIQIKIYDDNKSLLVRSAPEDSVYRGCESLLLSEGSHNIKVQISRLGTLAYGECFLDIHPASFYEELEKCTYHEVEAFINEDKTDKNEYDLDEYNCHNFSCDVAKNANNQGLKAVYVGIRYYEPKDETEGHAVVGFDTIDQGLVFIEPQSDERIDLQYGVSYLGSKIVDIYTGRVSGEHCLVKNWPEMEEKVKLEFFASLNEDTVADAVVSHLSLVAGTQASKDYVEDYTAALNSNSHIQVSSCWDEGHKCWDVLLQIENPHEYEHGDEFWTSAVWKVWDNGVVVPCDINALSIELTSTSD